MICQEQYVGTAIHENLETARAIAYQNMIEQITVFVTSDSRIQRSEINGIVTDSSAFTTLTSSCISLNDVREESQKTSDGKYLVRKIATRESVAKYFLQRRQRIIDLLEAVSRGTASSDKQIQVTSVVKNLYWAFLERLMYPDTLNYTFALGPGRSYTASLTGIRDAFQALIQDIEFTPLQKIDDDNLVYQYAVSLSGRSVANLHFNYYDGQGQTDASVQNGKVSCTFYYQKKNLAEKEVTAFVEYRFTEEMDPALAMADTMLHNLQMKNSVTFILPGSKKVLTKPAAPVLSQISEILAARGNFEELIKVLKNLEKKGRIITGNETDFGTIEGLYGLIVGKAGLEVIFRVEKGRRIDLDSGKEIILSDHAGKPLTYIEMLK